MSRDVQQHELLQLQQPPPQHHQQLLAELRVLRTALARARIEKEDLLRRLPSSAALPAPSASSVHDALPSAVTGAAPSPAPDSDPMPDPIPLAENCPSCAALSARLADALRDNERSLAQIAEMTALLDALEAASNAAKLKRKAKLANLREAKRAKSAVIETNASDDAPVPSAPVICSETTKSNGDKVMPDNTTVENAPLHTVFKGSPKNANIDTDKITVGSIAKDSDTPTAVVQEEEIIELDRALSFEIKPSPNLQAANLSRHHPPESATDPIENKLTEVILQSKSPQPSFPTPKQGSSERSSMSTGAKMHLPIPRDEAIPRDMHPMRPSVAYPVHQSHVEKNNAPSVKRPTASSVEIPFAKAGSYVTSESAEWSARERNRELAEGPPQGVSPPKRKEDVSSSVHLRTNANALMRPDQNANQQRHEFAGVSHTSQRFPPSPPRNVPRHPPAPPLEHSVSSSARFVGATNPDVASDMRGVSGGHPNSNIRQNIVSSRPKENELTVGGSNNGRGGVALYGNIRERPIGGNPPEALIGNGPFAFGPLPGLPGLPGLSQTPMVAAGLGPKLSQPMESMNLVATSEPRNLPHATPVRSLGEAIYGPSASTGGPNTNPQKSTHLFTHLELQNATTGIVTKDAAASFPHATLYGFGSNSAQPKEVSLGSTVLASANADAKKSLSGGAQRPQRSGKRFTKSNAASAVDIARISRRDGLQVMYDDENDDKVLSILAPLRRHVKIIANDGANVRIGIEVQGRPVLHIVQDRSSKICGEAGRVANDAARAGANGTRMDGQTHGMAQFPSICEDFFVCPSSTTDGLKRLMDPVRAPTVSASPASPASTSLALGPASAAMSGVMGVCASATVASLPPCTGAPPTAPTAPTEPCTASSFSFTAAKTKTRRLKVASKPLATAAEKPARIPRPPNAFMLYRSEKQPELVERAKGEGKSSRDFSRVLGEMWAAEAPAVRQRFQALAAERMKLHRQMYPEFRYRAPAASAAAGSKSSNYSKTRRASGSDGTSVAALVLCGFTRSSSRHVSATPPPPHAPGSSPTPSSCCSDAPVALLDYTPGGVASPFSSSSTSIASMASSACTAISTLSPSPVPAPAPTACGASVRAFEDKFDALIRCVQMLEERMSCEIDVITLLLILVLT
ncbi:hypothetical protein HDU84_001004 [Entophlyctis sp. JEL0112]|nr:hypothetical protein HDU84_001004 [Entophlyctis sp. JEL0112]